MAALAGMAAFCRERGIGFVTFVYRPQDASRTRLRAELLSEIETIGQESDPSSVTPGRGGETPTGDRCRIRPSMPLPTSAGTGSWPREWRTFC